MKKTIWMIALSLLCCFSGCRKEEYKEPVDTTQPNEQIFNGGFEDWHGTDKEMEPVHWHSFMSADGTGLAYNAARAQQVKPSTDVRPGSDGKYSVCIYARSILGIIANGNLTTGRIHVGSADADDASNYNFTQADNAEYCHVMTSRPDSIRFWAKFDCPDAAQHARMSAIIHDNYAYRDPENSDAAAHVVGKASIEFAKGDGNWHCHTLPFEYGFPAVEPHFILISFTTNREHGKGSKNDRLYIDDVELVYNR